MAIKSAHHSGIASTEVLSESGRAVKFVGGSRRAEIEAVVIDMGGRLPGVYLVTAHIGAQPLNEEASAAAVQAEEEGKPPLLVVRTYLGSGVERGAPFVDPKSEQLQNMGALTLAEKFPT